VVAVLLYVDWRMVRSKVGRAIFAIRENEISAASFGINVTAYKLLAFTVSGVFAGLGGSLFAHQVQLVQAANFDFTFALTLVLMVVVGGLGSRVGVFIGSCFFALFPLVFNKYSRYTALIGAVLLLLTLTQFQGGIAQQIEPILRWFRGGKLREPHRAQVVQTGGAGVRP
jgi:branched-chain amino acid transport system permease protein